MSTSSRRDAARARLVARFGAGRTDTELVGDALTDLAAAVSERGAAGEDEAYEVVSAESDRMRRERRERSEAGVGRDR